MDIFVRRHSEQLGRQFSQSTEPQDTFNSINSFDCRKWEWGHLRTECRNLGIERFYETYVQRLQRSFLSIFFVIHTIIGMTHTIVLVATQNQNPISPEVYCYLASILIVWISLISSFKEKLIRRHSWIPHTASSIAVIVLIILDVLVPLYHSVVTHVMPPLRPAYDSYVIFAIYIFLPLPENLHCIILGCSATACYIVVMAVMTYRLDERLAFKTATDCIYLLFVNFFGVYFRLLNEVAIRRAFLDRRDCVEGNLMLRFARDQEKNLLLSILPAHTAAALENAICGTIERIRYEKRMQHGEIDAKSLIGELPKRQIRGQPINNLYIEHHKNVSVLYADVVNYTQITTQLPVKTLVEVLHELFVKFDQASEEFNVLRIKFLGDCYYCVSGVPERNPYHARSCVDLGLRMIRDIREVRAQRNNLKIDMRIGVHSGSIMSGVIGACKWQYDIWSKDASIANRLETTGVPGKVHVTKQTLDLLNDCYLFEPGTKMARNDPLLVKHGIKTYLISPQYYGDFQYYTPEEINKRFSSGMKKTFTRNRSTRVPEPRPDVQKNFMQSSMEQYMEILRQTNIEMEWELDRMPIGKFHFNNLFANHPVEDDAEYDQSNFRSNLSTVLLFFRNRKWEWTYLNEPDLMLKYSVLMSFIVFVGIVVIQSLNHSDNWKYWLFTLATGTMLLLIVAIVWFMKIWIIWSPINEEDPNRIVLPKSRTLRFLYRVSKNIMRNAIVRLALYILTVGALVSSALIHLFECERIDQEIPTNDDKAEITIHSATCSNAWAITQSLILAICSSFMFMRINFLLKFSIGAIIVGVYAYFVFDRFDFFYGNSPSINASLSPKVAHILIVIFISVIFHLIDRQAEYISKIDFNWKQLLQEKQHEAECTKDTIKILVQNILPAHVAEIYLTRQMRDELYYEEYENVAIMFATITNYDMQTDAAYDIQKNVLAILNRIICDFDDKLLSQTGALRLEKIKVSGWTYMVACGLDPGRSDSSASVAGSYSSSNQRISILSNGRRSWSGGRNAPIMSFHSPSYDPATRERKQSSRQSQNVVYVLSEFALELMRSLDKFNKENFQTDGKLRIGISHGKVMAGVVGSSKPLYDVWGNCVNMASRMDSTGEAGKIQLTQNSAEELQSFGIPCEYRGETFVKGRGKIPTYFAAINEKMEFVRETAPTSLHHTVF